MKIKIAINKYNEACAYELINYCKDGLGMFMHGSDFSYAELHTDTAGFMGDALFNEMLQSYIEGAYSDITISNL